MNVAHLLIGQSRQRPAAAAIIEPGGAITFAELDERSARCAQALADVGLGIGDHVLVFVPMSIDLYLALIAIFRLGAVAVFLDPSAGADHINRCCDAVKPAAMIAVTKAHLLRLTSAALRRIPRHFTVGWPLPGARRWEHARRAAPLAEIAPRENDDPALVTFTSGSTGLPKGAVRSHGFLAAQHAALQRAIDLVPGEIDLATLPIFSLANLASGVTTVIPDADLQRPGAIDARPVLMQIVRQQVTRCVASPAFFERLLEVEEKIIAGAENDSSSRVTSHHQRPAIPTPVLRYSKKPDSSAPDPVLRSTSEPASEDKRITRSHLRHITRIYTGGAPVFPALLERLQRAMPQARVCAVYGSTEAEPIAEIAWSDISAADQQAMFAGGGLLTGHPVREIDLRIVPNRRGVPLAAIAEFKLEQLGCAPGQPGEIIVCGAHVLSGYLGGHGDEQTKWHIGDRIWHRTGDAGYLDEAGRLWLLGRAEAAITDPLGTVYPFAVECAASRIDGVARSALIQHNNQRILAIQRSRSAADSLREELLRDLAWARIQKIQFIPRLPLDKRHNAKIDYPALRQMLSK